MVTAKDLTTFQRNYVQCPEFNFQEGSKVLNKGCSGVRNTTLFKINYFLEESTRGEILFDVKFASSDDKARFKRNYFLVSQNA